MTTFILEPHERGLVTQHGQPVAFVGPGEHRFWFRRNLKLTRYNTDHIVASWTPELEHVLPNTEGYVLDVPDGSFALVSVNGVPYAVLEAGRQIVWTSRATVDISIVGTQEVIADVPRGFWSLMPYDTFTSLVVQPFERVLLYVDGYLEQVLGDGRYLISVYERTVEFQRMSLRETELTVTGQEVMTADKVSIRVNLILKFRVVDPVLAHESVDNLSGALYAELQMAARGFIGGVTIDGLLEDRNTMAQDMMSAVSVRAQAWGVEVIRTDVKDIVLPGEMKLILNQVITAEKQAQANLVMRREETAATRSLANTAKMLEKNPMLLRLKEMEAMQEMVASIDNLTVVAGQDNLLNLLKSE